MTTLAWDAPSNDLRQGVDKGVFYPIGGVGVPWNGLISVQETLDTTNQVVTYIDGQKIVNRLGLGSFEATIDAITYPDEFLPYDGYVDPGYSGQPRPLFNFLYRTQAGSGYLLHLVYNCQVSPTSRADISLNSAAQLSTFSWKLSTTPVPVQDARASAHFIVDSRTVSPGVLSAIESLLFGTATTDPIFPTISDFLAIFESNALFVVVDHGDGTWTATGPDSAILSNAGGQWEIDWPWVSYSDSETYTIKSY